MLYNKLLENLILPLGDRLNGSQFIKELRHWRQVVQLPEEELQALQRQKLTTLLQHATQNVPYFKELGTTPNDDPYEWIKQFPILKKPDIAARRNDFFAVPQEGLIEYASSGSSGIAGSVWMNKKEQSIIRAILMLWWGWAGYKMGKPILQTGMTPKRGMLKGIKDKLFRTRYYVAFGLSNDDSMGIINKQRGSKGYHLGGYASSLYVLADIAKKNGVKDVQFDAAISWGDKMFPHYRKRIEETFGARVYDTYAANEGLMIGAQYDLNYYYQMSPHVYLELVDKEGRRVEDGELGYVVVTRLDNHSFPLVRYYLGDLAVRLPRQLYPDHRKLQLPLLKQIIGRDTDIVQTPSGKHMIVHFFTGIFEFYPQVQQFRVVQRELGSMEVEYIPAADFEPSVLKAITKEIHDYLKEPFPITYTKVSHIPPTKSGKPQIIQSFLNQSQTA